MIETFEKEQNNCHSRETERLPFSFRISCVDVDVTVFLLIISEKFMQKEEKKESRRDTVLRYEILSHSHASSNTKYSIHRIIKLCRLIDFNNPKNDFIKSKTSRSIFIFLADMPNILFTMFTHMSVKSL